MSNNSGVISKRDQYMERARGKHPDKEFVDDESLFEQINADYDDYDNQLSSYKQNEESLSNLFSADPRSASFLMDWSKGEDPLVNLIRKYGDDFKAALEDPEKQEALALANKEFAERVAESDKYEEEYNRNIQETHATIDKLQQDQSISDDDIDKAMSFLVMIVRDGLVGKFSKESITMALKAVNYDTDIEQADIAGETRGKNTKIEEKLRKGKKGDGTADLHGKNGGSSPAKPKRDLGALDRFGENYSPQLNLKPAKRRL